MKVSDVISNTIGDASRFKPKEKKPMITKSILPSAVESQEDSGYSSPSKKDQVKKMKTLFAGAIHTLIDN